MVEADARELGERDGQDREVDAGHAEAEGKEADDRPREPRDHQRQGQATQGLTPKWKKSAAAV